MRSKFVEPDGGRVDEPLLDLDFVVDPLEACLVADPEEGDLLADPLEAGLVVEPLEGDFVADPLETGLVFTASGSTVSKTSFRLVGRPS